MRGPNGRERVGMLAVAAALVAGSAGASAQTAEDGRWLPWVGCWVEVQAPAGAPMTCLTPADGGVEMLVVGDDGTERRSLVADGADRPLSDQGCDGTEAIEFSDDGTRVYTRSLTSCEGGAERASRGLIAMVAPDQWIRVHAMDVGDRSVAWTQRYRPAPRSRIDQAGLSGIASEAGRRGMAIEAARMAAASPITVDDIIEANARTDAEAVRSWIAEQGDPLPIDADALVRMSDAGVPEEVIDVAIAVSFPERFALAHQRHGDEDFDRRSRYQSRRMRVGYWPSYYDPFFYSPYGYGYGYYGYYGRYSPWRYGYGYGSGYGPGYGYGGTVVVVRPVGEASGGRGRVVNGRGYTQGSSDSATRSRVAPSTSAPASPSRARASNGSSGSSSSSKGTAKKKGGN